VTGTNRQGGFGHNKKLARCLDAERGGAMRILFVCDSFLDSNNGTTITAQRFAQGLVGRVFL